MVGAPQDRLLVTIERYKFTQIIPKEANVRSKASLMNWVIGQDHSLDKFPLPRPRIVVDPDVASSTVTEAVMVKQREISESQFMRSSSQQIPQITFGRASSRAVLKIVLKR